RNAVEASMKAINLEDEPFLEEILLEVVSELPNKAAMTIDEIQHCVENTLMKSPYPDVARAYIEYRHDRAHERENIT
ncbi:anaerobic ribonucleoside-triphosphate reductase, partial [Listeria monocytogenes]|nr:anaerobic ribonucleoside-triphosphate reductase [Listeria monocytogenes]